MSLTHTQSIDWVFVLFFLILSPPIGDSEDFNDLSGKSFIRFHWTILDLAGCQINATQVWEFFNERSFRSNDETNEWLRPKWLRAKENLNHIWSHISLKSTSPCFIPVSILFLAIGFCFRGVSWRNLVRKGSTVLVRAFAVSSGSMRTSTSANQAKRSCHSTAKDLRSNWAIHGPLEMVVWFMSIIFQCYVSMIFDFCNANRSTRFSNSKSISLRGGRDDVASCWTRPVPFKTSKIFEMMPKTIARCRLLDSTPFHCCATTIKHSNPMKHEHQISEPTASPEKKHNWMWNVINCEM